MIFIYFMLYLFLEVMLSSYIAGEIGGLLVFVEILFSAIVGVLILRNFKYALFENLTALFSKTISHNEFMRMNISTALGAILLILPGFFTDMIGLLLQFEFVTALFANRYLRKDSKNFYSKSYYNTYSNSNTQTQGEKDVIDVEIIEKDAAAIDSDSRDK